MNLVMGTLARIANKRPHVLIGISTLCSRGHWFTHVKLFLLVYGLCFSRLTHPILLLYTDATVYDFITFYFKALKDTAKYITLLVIKPRIFSHKPKLLS